MTVTDEAELWALLNALLDLKFGESGCSAILAGSSPLGQVIDRLWEEFKTTRIFQKIMSADAWNTRMKLTPDRNEWSRIVTWITDTEVWNSWPDEQKQHYVRVLALPCVIHPDYMGHLLAIRSH